MSTSRFGYVASGAASTQQLVVTNLQTTTATVTGLTPNFAVVTDAESTLASMRYAPTVIASSLMSRDSSGNTAVAALSATSTTQSTTASTGAIVTAGGLGVAKDARIAGDLLVTGDATCSTLHYTALDPPVSSGAPTVIALTNGDAGTTLTNSTAEVTIMSTTLPAGQLTPAGSGVLLEGLVNICHALGGNKICTIRAYLGSSLTALPCDQGVVQASKLCNVRLLVQRTGVNMQYVKLQLVAPDSFTAAGPTYYRTGGFNATETSSSALVLRITAQWDTANLALLTRAFGYTVTAYTSAATIDALP